MAEQISKLSPHRDLQCYFLTPSAVAAMSQANESGFVVSGSWRQQFDWAVVEWNRDNVFEHPALRYLPDGDLSGLSLSYQEQRTGCIPFESNLYPVVDWNNLRIWAPNVEGLPNTAGVTETVYHVDLAGFTKPVTIAQDGYSPASATMTLVPSSLAGGDQVGLAWLNEYYFYTLLGGEDLSTIAQGLTANINDPGAGSQTFRASWSSAAPDSVTVTWSPQSPNAPYQNLLGANGNRLGMYGFASRGLNAWQNPSAAFSGGTFPSTYEVTLNFGALAGYYQYYDHSGELQSQGVSQIPTSQVRKVRWTWTADLQPGTFERTPFQVNISNWTVTGTNRTYSVAGPGSRRIEDNDNTVVYSGTWTPSGGNYSGSTIQTAASGASCSISYTETASHELFLGTRLLTSGATVSVTIDGGSASIINLALSGEDVLVRTPLGTIGAGTHTITLIQTSADSTHFWFDFLEIAYPSHDLPDFIPRTQLALATDWDTYHSQSLPAERTAWLISKLGFVGRVDHYVGALWFYELVRTGTQYASADVNVSIVTGAAAESVAELQIDSTPIDHSLLPNDTPETLAQGFALLINNGSNSIWATASGSTLTITARAMGTAGNGISIGLGPKNVALGLTPRAVSLSGGLDGTSFNLDANDPLQSTLMAATQGWCTDLTAMPRINQAAWDWHVAYFTALKEYGIDAAAAFSTELGNGDPSDQVGIAQRYWDDSPVVVNTPAVQTNFSTAALVFWEQVYLEMASIQASAGMLPYLQFGEVQWWYFPKSITVDGVAVDSMTFYDAYTKQQFSNDYGVNMQLIQSTASPAAYPNETAFLPTLIGAYTAAIRSALETQFAGCRCEVLYPNDTNNTPLNEAVNFPTSDWTPANLTCLKTESFGYTSSYNLDESTASIAVSAAKGFPNSQRSHLVGISQASSSWMKEVDIAQSQGLESVVLWALDQYCLIGYAAPPFVGLVRSGRQG